jgi:aminopeptidase N
VTTADFQTEMEQATGKNLSDFFSQWVYLTQDMPQDLRQGSSE